MAEIENRKQHVAWRMLLTTHAVITKRIIREMDAEDCISLDTFDVLITLSEASAKSMRMSELAEATFFSNSGISRRVATLEKEGLIQRDRCADDGRVFYAALTESGEKALKEAWPIYERLIDENFADLVSKTGANHLVRALKKVLHQLDDGNLTEVLREERTEKPRL